MAKPKIHVKLVGKDSHTAYIALPGFPLRATSGCVARTVALDDLVENYSGPRVHLDFDKEQRLIGIENLA